jgi:hypothetical protein
VPSPPRAADHELVSFSRPPVQEVALALQFSEQVVDLELFAAFSSAVRAELPHRDYQPPLPPMDELFDMPRPMPSFQMTFDPSFALPRTWFISADGAWLVQLQADRLTLNWRRQGGESVYPRYGQIRARLVGFLDLLGQCGREVGARAAPINFCEVLYVNPIVAGGAAPGQTQHPHAATFLRDLRPWAGGRFLPQPEDMQVQARWRIPGENGAPVGRLYVALSPGYRPEDMMPIYMMNLTSRVIPSRDNRESALEALDLGHRWAVLAFDDLTTPEMHDVWAKRGGD